MNIIIIKVSIPLLLAAGMISAAEIRGTVYLSGRPVGPAQVCYQAVTASGEKISNMAGITLGDRASSAWCDTYKPRRTGLKWDPRAGLSFEHTHLPAGKYVVAVKHGNFLDWKFVEVSKESSVVEVPLKLDLLQTGKLHVQITTGTGDYQVVLVPFIPDGKPNATGLDLAESFHLRLSADVTKGDVADFKAVKPGRYQLTLRAVKKLSVGQGGWSAMLTDLASVPVMVEAGKDAAWKLP